MEGKKNNHSLFLNSLDKMDLYVLAFGSKSRIDLQIPVWAARSSNWLPYRHHLILIIARQNWLLPSSTWRMVPLCRGRGAPAPVETLLCPNSCLQLTAAQPKAFKVCSLFSLGCMGTALERLTCCGLLGQHCGTELSRLHLHHRAPKPWEWNFCSLCLLQHSELMKGSNC